MLKPNIKIPDWAVGGLVTAVLLLASLFQFGPLETIEAKLYDLRAKTRSAQNNGQNIAIVEIDEPSVAQLGRYPWPRSRVAEGLDVLADAGAKVIGLDILYPDPEQNQGLDALKNVRKVVEENSVVLTGKQITSTPPGEGGDAAAKAAPSGDKRVQAFENMLSAIDETAHSLDSDTRLSDSIALTQNTILPVYFTIGVPVGRSGAELAPKLLQNFATQVDNPGGVAAANAVIQGLEIKPPIPGLVEAAQSLGHINIQTDPDGVLRSHLLLVEFDGKYFPSFATQIAKAFLNLQPFDTRVILGQGIQLGGIQIPTDPQFKMLVSYNPPSWTAERNPTFPYYSFVDVLNKKIQPDTFKGKIVLIGVTLTGLGEQNVTSRAPRLPGVEVIANVVENILDQNFIRRPGWANTAELILIVLFGAFISFGVPRLSAGKSAAITGILTAIVIGVGVYLFAGHGIWLKILYPALTLVGGYTVMVSKRFLITEKEKEVLTVDSIETNKMLGLSFQGQGMLDLAFEKFRKCPVDDAMKDLLYNLGLDFERKRMFNKAVAVYEHISKVDSKFKDLAMRMDKVRTAGETVIFGGGGGMKRGADATVMMEGVASAASTLGRYEVMKELGRGAMGIVYLGKDPKINRTVAIKTLRLEEDDMEPDEKKAVRERFFREAESAGRLSHPNIVTIYDAGEEHDICYIAMELLDGADLKDRCQKNTLMSAKEVMELVAKVADALDYAHQQGIVHRDIKPANIMVLKNGIVKVTDFGIARITSSSKTATGTVMGTPSYMSPEQLMGKKVDGRADLFSLAVVLYEMLTGQKPFEAESMATLMYKIANESPPPPTVHNQDLPPEVVAIIEKGMQKDPDQRYQRGSELAAVLRQAIPNMK